MSFSRLLFIFVLAAGHLSILSAIPLQPINTRPIHLGINGKPEWDRFTNAPPSAQALELSFQSSTNNSLASLLIRQDDVKWDWAVELNGKKIGSLFPMEADLWHTLAIPPGTLRDGANQLKISTKQPEDILVHQIYLAAVPSTNLLNQARLHVEVREKGRPLPCRITVADEHGTLAPLQTLGGQRLAIRPGVAYTADGVAELGLLPGKYTIYATRGPEYSLAKAAITIEENKTTQLTLSLARQVPTPGWAACDTHIHTFELSGHGDSMLGERMLTIAGEGLELPVCTEHNQHATYQKAAAEMGVASYFTAIAGNEVTTAKGHFNIFPIEPGATVPDYKIEDWPKLMKNLRATPGVQVVVLNHPYNIHNNFQPFAPTNFVARIGRNLRRSDFEVDAVELINSGAMQSDWMRPYRAWFGLLNYGYKIAGVGSSDSHDVSRYIVGQGRTYIQCDDREPGKIDINEACRNLRSGRSSVSLGLFTTIKVNNAYGPGDLAALSKHKVHIKVEVFGPDWISAEKVTLYANGRAINHQQVSEKNARKAGRKATVDWTIDHPKQDLWLVAIATGPGVTGPYWATAKPYQPTSTHWEPVVIGSTNPVWIDADGDGKFTSAREYAQALVRQAGTDQTQLDHLLQSYDPAVREQLQEQTGK